MFCKGSSIVIVCFHKAKYQFVVFRFILNLLSEFHYTSNLLFICLRVFFFFIIATISEYQIDNKYNNTIIYYLYFSKLPHWTWITLFQLFYYCNKNIETNGCKMSRCKPNVELITQLRIVTRILQWLWWNYIYNLHMCCILYDRI